MLTLVRETEVDPKLAHYQNEGYAKLARELIFDTIRECYEHRKLRDIKCPLERTTKIQRLGRTGAGVHSVTEESIQQWLNSTTFDRAIQTIGCSPEVAKTFLNEILDGKRDVEADGILYEYYGQISRYKMSERDGRALRYAKKKKRKQA